MKKIKKRLRTVIICTIFSLVSFSSAVQANVAVSCADFGDVLVGDTSTLIMTITNTGFDSLFLVYDWDLNPCGFTATKNFKELLKGEFVEVTLEWTPSSPGECYGILEIYNMFQKVAEVEATGNGITEFSMKEKPGIQGLLDSFDARVGVRDIVGKGPGKSADNRLNAFRNMLVEAKLLVEQERNAEAYGQLMAAKKKIGEFITDSNSVNIAAASSTSATGSLEHLMDKVLESLMQ
jgi:hypothetical protein